jgi:glycine/D-amino acid oxidase-like deaminating enzyme
MLHNARSHGLWELTAPAAPRTERLTGNVTAEIVIVGGGYTGLSAALHLAEEGADVVLLEAVEIGFGGAGRNVGLVNAGMWIMPNALNALLGRTYGERLLQLLGDAPKLVFDLIEKHQIDCEVEQSGTLHCAVGVAGLNELKQRAAQWLERGVSVRLLDREETTAKVGTAAYAGSLLDPRAGTIQPLAYARGLARAAITAGARVFTGTHAEGAERAHGKWIVRTAQGGVSADWVFVATDAYTRGPWAELRNEQVHLPYFNLATEPLPHEIRRTILPERQGAWDTKRILSSFRFDRSGRLVFGSVGALRGAGTTVHRSWAKRALRSRFPQMEGVHFESEWYGQIGMTKDGLPRLHKLAPNVLSVSGYNGRGIAPGTVFGREIARHIQGRILEEDLPLPVVPMEAATLRVAKEIFYEIGAQIAHFSEYRF